MELDGNSNSGTSVAFLRQLRERHSGPLNVIWDNAPAHRGEAMREYLRTPGLGMRLVNLPGYSPDFNADEAIWGWAREEATGNLCLGSKEAVEERVGKFLSGLSTRKDEVKRRCRDCPALKGRNIPARLPARLPTLSKCTSHLGFGLDGHDAEKQKTIVTGAGKAMAALPGKEKIARRLNEAETGRLHVTDTFRFNSQATAGCLTSQRSIGGRGWPTVTNRQSPTREGHRPVAEHEPGHHRILGDLQPHPRRVGVRQPEADGTAASVGPQSPHGGATDQHGEGVFERWSSRPMLPACDAWKDQERIELDRQVLEEVLNLSSPALRSVEILRNRFCCEPTVLDLKAHRAGTAEKIPELRALTAG